MQKITRIGSVLFLGANLIYSFNDPLELTVTTHLGAGFFCEFLKVIDNILHFEDEHLVKVEVDWTHEFFPYKNLPRENGWDLYFDPIETGSYDQSVSLRKIRCDSGYHELHDQLCRDTWVLYDKYLPYRLAANEKIKKYIKIKSHILKKAEDFYAAHMAGCICIGVHVRFASAHNHEVPGGRAPSINDYMAEVNALLKKHAGSAVKIFLATDSHVVVNRFRDAYAASMLTYIDAYRAPGSQDPGLVYENTNYWLSHPGEFHQKKAGYFGGESTLLDGLLLSKCDYLIHTTSNVSTFVSFMNPYINSIYLPKNIGPKPCHARSELVGANVKNKWLMYLS